MTSPLLRSLLATSVLSALLLSCGEPSDRPQDCTANEYFDEAQQLCESCPALLIPSCREGCPITVSDDERGCPAAACELSCEGCPEGTSFSLETLSCEPLCPEGATFDPALDACSSCTPDPDAPTSCEGLGCSCQLLVSADADGCPVPSCGRCTAPTQGYSVDETGACVADTP